MEQEEVLLNWTPPSSDALPLALEADLHPVDLDTPNVPSGA